MAVSAAAAWVRAEPLGRGETAGEEADRGAFDITFAARDLAGEAQPRHRLEPQRRIEQRAAS